MSECLITTLKESVTDPSLRKLGDIVIHIKNKKIFYAKSIIVGGNDAITLTVTEPGYFTDITGTSNFGRTATTTYKQFYLSDGEYDLIISNKYAVNFLNIIEVGSNNQPQGYSSGYSFNFDEFYAMTKMTNFRISGGKEMKGDISSLENCSTYMYSLQFDNTETLEGDIKALSGRTHFTNFVLVGSKVTGDVNAILASNTGLTSVYLQRNNLRGTLSTVPADLVFLALSSNAAIGGNLNVFSGHGKLKLLHIANTAIVGNLNSLSDVTTLTSLDVSDTSITGDTSSLASLTNLTTFNYTNTAITGTWPLT